MSRQPPLPAGLPPRPSTQASYARHGDSHGDDSYRPRGDDSYQPRAQPQEVFQFGAGNSYRPNYDQRPPRSPPRYNDYAPGTSRSDNYHRSSYNHNDRGEASGSGYRPNNSNSFDFRYDAPSGLDYNAADSRRRRSPPRQRDRRPATYSGNARGGARGGYRGRGGPRLASDREFLKTTRGPTPELMVGMDEDIEQGAKYKAVDEMSDSDEVEMDMSDDDSNGAQGPKKKQVRTDGKAADGDSVPRWSNPDPYTALPPPDETRSKKKDVVQLIRKARVTSSSEHTSKPAEADDFISFDLGDKDETEDDSEPEAVRAGVPGAPTGPRELFGSANEAAPKSQANGASLPGGAVAQNQQTQSSHISSNDSTYSIKQQAKATLLGKKDVIDLTSDSALGSRKRNFRDEIKPPPILHDMTKGKPRGQPDGSILREWRPKHGLPASPWLGIDHSDSANMGVWLHKEIVDFHEFVKPRDFEQLIRTKLVQDLEDRVKQYFDKDDEIQPFGSFPAGLYLPTADMDLVCLSSEFRGRGQKIFGQGMKGLRTFRSFLLEGGLPLKNEVEMIGGAKVPLVKYVDKLTGLKVDISFENITGITANNTFQDWRKQFPAMPILVTLIKHLLAMRGLNEPVSGGIGGFSVTCLVVSLLQNMPQVQSRSMIPEHHLGEILMEFLDLYGNQFNTMTTAISMNPPGYVPKNQIRNIYSKGVQGKFFIIDPNQSNNDIAGGSSNTMTIRQCFSDAYDKLQKRMADLQHSGDRRNQSILECIIGGDYSSFDLQRKHLAHVHEKLFPQQ